MEEAKTVDVSVKKTITHPEDMIHKQIIIADSTVRLIKYVIPKKEIVFKNGHKIIFWFSWSYGMIKFWNCMCTERNGRYWLPFRNSQFIKLHVPDIIWFELARRMAITNPFTMSPLEFMEKVQFSKKFTKSLETLGGIVFQSKDEKEVDFLKSFDEISQGKVEVVEQGSEKISVI